MSNITFQPFKKQNDFLWTISNRQLRAVGAFAGKRGGKTEVGAVGCGMLFEQNYKRDWNSIDPYLMVITAPTYDMLKRLSWKKFQAYWKDFVRKDTISPMEMHWYDSDKKNNREKLIYGISADNPARIEGVKASIIWIDEVLQVTEQFFLECIARTADTGGIVICTGSLGVQFINPKQHWAYKYFKEQIDESFACFEWATADNPYFSKEEISRLERTLDKKTFEQMFTINWDVTPASAVYEDFSTDNIISEYQYNPEWQSYISIDWGWTHPMSCGFYQYDAKNDVAYKFDEIFVTKTTIDQLYEMILEKPYVKSEPFRYMDDKLGQIVTTRKVNNFIFVADIAGNQEREQTGISNIAHFEKTYGIRFVCRQSAILKGISIVRSYIKTVSGLVRFKVHERCKETIAGFKRYAFPDKDGAILSELPVKKDDDAMDETRYFFWNVLDKDLQTKPKQYRL